MESGHSTSSPDGLTRCCTASAIIQIFLYAKRPLAGPLSGVRLSDVAALDADEDVGGENRADQSNKKNASIHLLPLFWWIFHPTHVSAAPTMAAPQLAGEMTTPIMQPAPKVKNHVSQYFISASPQR